MGAQKSNSKRQRTSRKSAGTHGASHHPLSAIEKVLIGKGLMQSIKHVSCLKPWRGAGYITTPYDARQAAENRLLYPHLFHEEK